MSNHLTRWCIRHETPPVFPSVDFVFEIVNHKITIPR